MPLIVETGTGDASAESYASVADFKAYHKARGNDAAVDLDSGPIEILLRKATEYMVGAYCDVWLGTRAGRTQALDWPRVGARAHGFDVPVDEVPQAVKDACCILADKVRTGPLAPDLGRRVKRSKVGPIETEFDDYAPELKRYISVDRKLAPYLVVASYSIKLVRN